MYHDYYRHKTWEAKHCWVNQFGIIEYDIFAHIPPQHYVVKWKEEFESIFVMFKSMDAYSEDMAGMCKLYLVILNGAGNLLDDGTVEKDF